MKKLIQEYIIEKWWFSTLVFIITLILFFTGYFGAILSLLLLTTGILFLILTGIIQLFNKVWSGLLNLGIALITIVLFTLLIYIISPFIM